MNDTLSQVILASYPVMSVLAILAYAVDKHAAQTGAYRVSEQALILLGLFGGWPGALLAQRLFRHKTVKRSFQSLFWVSVVANLVLVTVALVLSQASG